MTDIFKREDLLSLFQNKKVVLMGDSNIRALYKDLLCLYSSSEIIHGKTLKAKMESSVFKDTLVSHGEKMNGRDYREERRLVSKSHHLEFYFITRVFNDYVKEVLDKAMQNKKPDVIMINSCLWDLSRWGPNGVSEYKENMIKLMKHLNKILGSKCLVIWMTTPPISSTIRGGFLVVQLDFLKYCLRFHVMEANTYCQKVVLSHGYDVLDIHYHLRMQLQRRSSDGIHWLPAAVRYVTNLLLTHISLSWGVPLPHRYESIVTQRTLTESNEGNDAQETPSQNNAQDTSSQHDAKKSKQLPTESKKKNHMSHHAFEKRQKKKQSMQRIRVWSNNPHRPPYGNQGAPAAPQHPMWNVPGAPYNWFPQYNQQFW